MSNRLVSAFLGWRLLLIPAQVSAAVREIAVALFADDGVGVEDLLLAEEQLAAAGIPAVRLSGEEIRAGGLSTEFVAVVFLGGKGGLQSSVLQEGGPGGSSPFCP